MRSREERERKKKRWTATISCSRRNWPSKRRGAVHVASTRSEAVSEFFFCVCVRRRCRCLTWSTNFFCRVGKTILRVAIRGDWETRETNAGRRRDESRARRRSPHAGGVVLAVGVPRTRRLGGFSARVVSFFSLFLPLKRPPFDKKTREKRNLGGVLLSFYAD